MKPNIWIVIAAYNECETIADVIQDLLQLNLENINIVVVDDGSTDHTDNIAKNLNVNVLKHCNNLGQGAALATGFKFSLLQNADIIITFDADGQMQAVDVEKFIEKIIHFDYDVVLGSRFLEHPPIGISFVRVLILKLALILTRLTTGLKLTDTHNGFRAIKASAAKRIMLTQNRMAHASEIISEISRLNLSYCEVPVTIKYTEYSKGKGQSNFNFLNILFEAARRS